MKIAIPIDFDDTSYKINKAYVDYVVEAKMTPIIITPDNIRLIAQCKGLLLPGGIDIDPMYYGIDNFNSYNVNPEKDKFERATFYKAIKHQLPIFGICRGFQLVMYEILLTHQEKDLPIVFKQHIDWHAQIKDIAVNRHIRSHKVKINGETFYGVKNIEEIGVNSMHHQGAILMDAKINLNKFGRNSNIKVVAWSDKLQKNEDDDFVLIEGIHTTLWGNNICAVQWHPEELRDVELIKHFFDNNEKEKKMPTFDFLNDSPKLVIEELPQFAVEDF